MSDSHPFNDLELTLKPLSRHAKSAAPVLTHVASPSPEKARRRPATERPSLQTASVAPVKLPSELFAIATSRSSQGDVALSKAIDGIQAAATRLETERTKLVIQSQELQIWDMAREEELVLLRAENEHLEQQLAVVADKVGKGLGRDGVLESLQFALRKARLERDAEMREADVLFNQMQEAKAASMELQELHSAFSAALSGLRDDWSAQPVLSEEARELWKRAEAAVQDPTSLGSRDMSTLLRGLVALASRGGEIQQKLQSLQGENVALQQMLDSAHYQLAKQEELIASHSTNTPARVPRAEGVPVVERGSDLSALSPGQGQAEQGNEAAVLRRQVTQLQAKLAEYRVYLEENQQEIEVLQGELKQLRQGHEPAGVQEAGGLPLLHHAKAGGPREAGRPRRGVLGGRSITAAGAGMVAQAAEPTWRRQKELEVPRPPHLVAQQAQPLGTPTRHVPSSSSPISTVNYGGSPPLASSTPNRGSPISQQAVADFARKIVELQELALRAQQQSAEREADTLDQHEYALASLRQQLSQLHDTKLAAQAAQLSQQHAAELAEAQGREADLVCLHARTLEDLEAQAARLEAQHTEAITGLHAQMAKLSAQHAQAWAERNAAEAAQLQQRLQEREMELVQMHQDAMVAAESQAELRMAEALKVQAAELAHAHAQGWREAEKVLMARQAADLRDLEERLERQFDEHQARRDVEARHKHDERLAEQAAQLTKLHAQAISNREAQLLRQFECELVERESQLANAQADQLRGLEARFAAAATAAADQQEAQLRDLFAEQLAQALLQQRESLAAAAAQAERRLKEEHMEVVEATMEQVRVSQAAAVWQLEEARRREEELAAQVEDQRRQIEELEHQVLTLQNGGPIVQRSPVEPLGDAAATAVLNAAKQAKDLIADTTAIVEARGLVADRESTNADVVYSTHREQSASTIGGPVDVDQVLRLAEQSEQLQQYANELEAVFEEAERRRQEAAAEVERQNVEVVSRLGREYEKATSETRAAHELREANLRRMLQRQTEEAQDSERRHHVILKKLQEQLQDLWRLLGEERERHNRSSLILELQAAELAEKLDATQQREAEMLRSLSTRQALSEPAPRTEERQARKRMPPSVQPAVECPPDVSSPPRVVLGTEGPPASTAGFIQQQPSSSVDAWSDGQLLLWPARVAAPVSASDIQSGGEAAAPAPAPAVYTVAAAMPSVQSAQAGHSPREGLSGPLAQHLLPRFEDKAVDPLEPSDLASNLIDALRGLAVEIVDGGPSDRLWGTSIELDVQAASRQGLLGAACSLPPSVAQSAIITNIRALSTEESTATGVQSSDDCCAGGVDVGALEGAGCLKGAWGAEEPGAEVRAFEDTPAAINTPGRWAAGDEEARGGVAWGELVGSQVAAPGVVVENAANSMVAAAATFARPVDGASPVSGPGYISEAATSVSTDTEYNSDTEFYVDDEDDDEHRGRALVEALAQSPRASQCEVPVQLPPLLQELQQRRRTQSAGAVPVPPVRGKAAIASPNSGQGAQCLPWADVRARSGPTLVQRVCSLTEGTDELEATLSGSFPALEAALLSEAARAGEHPSVADISTTVPLDGVAMAAPLTDMAWVKATLIRQCPLLPISPWNAQNPPSPPPPSLPPSPVALVQGEAGEQTGSAVGEGDGDTAASATTAVSPAVAAPFTFPWPDRSAPCWDGTPLHANSSSPIGPNGGANTATAVVSSRSGELINLTDSSSGFQGTWSPGGTVATATPSRSTDLGTGLIPGATVLLNSSADAMKLGCGLGSENSGRRSGQQPEAGHSHSESGCGSRTSFDSCSLPPIPRPRLSVPTPQRKLWLEISDGSDDGAAAVDGNSRDDGTGEPGLGAAASTKFPCGATDDHDADGDAAGGITAWQSPTVPGHAASRAAALGLTPLMRPNPLFNDVEDVSPPWSAADWQDGASPTMEPGGLGEQGDSLPPTPGSEPNQSGSGGSSRSSTSHRRSNRYNDGGSNSSSSSVIDGHIGTVAEQGARQGASYEAWNMLYDMSTEHSTHSWEVDAVPDRDDPAASGEPAGNVRSRSHQRSPFPVFIESTVPHVDDEDEEQQVSSRTRDIGNGQLPCGAGGLRDAEVEEEDEQQQLASRGVLGSAYRREDEEDMKKEDANDDEPGDDDMRSLLAAGATLSNSEKRRRQRRRMADAPIGLVGEHPIDLLRQGWEISGGVASPISPRRGTTPCECSPVEAADSQPGSTESPRRTQQLQEKRLGASSTELQRRQEEAYLQDLLPLNEMQHGHRSCFPERRSSITSASPSCVSPLDRWKPPPPLQVPILSPRKEGHPGSGASARVRPFTDIPALQTGGGSSSADREVAPAGDLATMLGSSCPPSDLSPSRLEARQRSRTLLSRARSRVAELEDQCRALAALSFHQIAAAEADPDADVDAFGALAPAPRHELVPAGTHAAETRVRSVTSERSPDPNAIGCSDTVATGAAAGGYTCRGDGSGKGALVLAQQPPTAPAEMVDALDDLRGDLNELEALHRLTVLATRVTDGVKGSRIAQGALTPSLESRLSVALLGGLERGTVAAAVVETSPERMQLQARPSPAAVDVVHGHASPLVGSQPSGSPSSATCHVSVTLQKESLVPSKAHGTSLVNNTPLATTPEFLRRAGQQQQQHFTAPAMDAEESDRAVQAPAADNVSAAAAAVAAVAATTAPHFTIGGAWSHGRRAGGSSVAVAGDSAAGPSSIASPSLDPALIELLQVSIQAQVQAQLGQLEAKIVDLQRQNQALLAAATAASTPATPLPPQLLRFGGPGSVTPLPMARLNAIVGGGVGAARAVDAAIGDAEHGPSAAESLWSSGAQESDAWRLASGSGSGGGAIGMASMGQLGVLREALRLLPALWASTPPSVLVSEGASEQASSMSGLSMAAGATSQTPHAGLRAQASVDTFAGPYSPEELSKLPPAVQLFAPPQLRAAALAAVREHPQAHQQLSQ